MTASGQIVAVGHVGLNCADVDRLAAFYRDVVGLSQAVLIPGVVAIFEVGDTDFFLQPGERTPAEFDLAADDVDAFRARLVASQVSCEEARDEPRTGHRSFAFVDPDGNRVRATSAHLRTRRS